MIRPGFELRCYRSVVNRATNYVTEAPVLLEVTSLMCRKCNKLMPNSLNYVIQKNTYLK